MKLDPKHTATVGRIAALVKQHATDLQVIADEVAGNDDIEEEDKAALGELIGALDEVSTDLTDLVEAEDAE